MSERATSKTTTNYELMHTSVDDLTELAVRSLTDMHGFSTFTATATSQQSFSWKEALQHLPGPGEDYDAKEIYTLLETRRGLSSRFKRPGTFASIAPALGMSFHEEESVDGEQWKGELTLKYPSLDAANEAAAAILPSNTFTHVPFEGGVYKSIEFTEALLRGEHLAATDEPWHTHGRATHDIAERALGQTFLSLEQATFEQVLQQEGANPNSERLRQAMLAHDTLTNAVTIYALTSDGETIIPGDPTSNLEWLLQRFWTREPFMNTSTRLKLGQRPTTPGSIYPPFVVEQAEEIRSRLSEASTS